MALVPLKRRGLRYWSYKIFEWSVVVHVALEAFYG
jgi:hypothetical protein